MGHTTIISKQMKKWSKYFVTQVQLLEKQNKTLKLKILKLTQELEKKETNDNIVYFCAKCQEGQTHAYEKSGMSGSDLPLPSEDVKSPLDEVHVGEEPVHVFIPGNLQTQTSYLDDDIEIDIKEEDMGFEHSKSKSNEDISNTDPVLHLNVTQASDIPIKHEIEKSIQRMFRSEALVPNNETTREEVSTEVETELDLNHYSSSRTINVLSVKSFIPQPQVSNQRLCGQKKKPCLTTRTAEKIHKCETCPKTFDTRFKLMVHNKSHTGEKQCRRNHKTSFRCVICKKSFTTKIILTDHLRTHTRQKLFRITLRTQCGKSYKTEKHLTDHMRTIHTRSLRSSSSNMRFSANCKMSVPVGKAIPGKRCIVRNHREEKDNRSRSLLGDKKFSAKRSLTIENQKVNPGGRSKKLRRVETEGKVSIAEEIAGVEEGIDPPCVVETNPLKIDKILGLILSNLGKHDLLNARMVSHAWNDESLKVLRKSNFTQLLTEEMIKEYILFITSIEPYPFIIPFHFNFEISSGFLGLRTLKCVQCLCQRFGPECVSTLTLTSSDKGCTEENIREGGLIDLLTLISPGLNTLDLTKLNFEIDFLQNQIITFPNLKKLICNTRQCISGTSGPGMSYISIIEKSPKLEDLTLTHPCDLESWPLKFNQLKSLSLDTMINLQNILDKILTSFGPPVLRDLSFRDRMWWDADDKLLVFKILESVSSTLKSLTIWEHLPFYRDGGFSKIMRFPILPHLEHLGLEYNVANGHKYSPNPEYINLSGETFPSLKSIELPFGLIFTTPPPVQSAEDDDAIAAFPSIKLTLRVGPTSADSNRALEQLQNIFPIPSKLSLVNVEGNESVKHLLDRILKSNWSKNIQDIGMIGFHQNYLGQVLNQFPENYDGILEQGSKRNELQNTTRRMTRMRVNCVEAIVPADSIILTTANQSDSMKMTNITTIKLELIDESTCDRGSSDLSTTAYPPNLTGMVKHFPKLRVIEVSELLLNLWNHESMWRGHFLEF